MFFLSLFFISMNEGPEPVFHSLKILVSAFFMHKEVYLSSIGYMFVYRALTPCTHTQGPTQCSWRRIHACTIRVSCSADMVACNNEIFLFRMRKATTPSEKCVDFLVLGYVYARLREHVCLCAVPHCNNVEKKYKGLLAHARNVRQKCSSAAC